MTSSLTSIKASLSQDLLQDLQETNCVSPTEAFIRTKCEQWFREKSYQIPQSSRAELIEKVVYSIVGLGPLEFLLRDAAVSEIMVNGFQDIFVEEAGQIRKTDLKFQDEAHLIRVINRIVGQVGRRVDQKNPLVDARLLDGSRVNAVLEPLSLSGAVLTIRKFPSKAFTFEDVLLHGSATEEMVVFLRDAIKNKQNILISGGTGAGKTSTLNACAASIPDDERIVTLEDVAEIRIDHPHHVALESRGANIEGEGEIPIRTLVKNALRMRPDRILVGEIRGEEVIDMLQAMNTGHKGSITTVHANAPLESLYRLETMVLMGGDMPIKAIRPQIVRGIDLIIQQERLGGGSRKITYITKVDKTSLEGFEVTDLFVYDEEKGGFQNYL